MKNSYTKTSSSSGYISASPMPTLEELRKFYAESYYQDPKSSTYQKSYDELEVDYKNLKCDALLSAISDIGAQSLIGKSFLDIGAGEGFLLNAAYKNDCKVTGLDFSGHGVNKFFPHLSSMHIVGDVFQQLSIFASQKKKFSICAAVNILEHVLDPNLFLESIRNVMELDGLLAVTVPNDYSLLQNFALKEGMIDEEFWFVPPHHLHYFNAHNIVSYMKESGFEILDAFSDFPVDLFLLHPGSNYSVNKANGSDANRARMQHDLLIHQHNGMSKYLDYYRAMFNVGLGRDVTVIVRPIRN